MNSKVNRWQNKGAIVVVRQSDDKDGTASTAAQLDYMKHDLERVGMRFIDKETLEGVSGSSPAKLTVTVEKLFKRKKDKNDFDVIAWQVEDRASRSGGEFGMWLQHEAKRHGLLVYFAGDESIDSPYSAVVRVSKYEAAKEVSVSNGRRSTQGQEWAKKLGFFRTAGPTPMGCNRLYLGADDKPKYFLRNVGNGLQEQIDFATKVVIGRYGTIGKKSRNRFKKQRVEYSLLMPGDPEKCRIIRIIFYLRYKRGWRGWRIADFLNRHQVVAPKGGDWSPRQVESIYENEAYIGVTYNDQTYSGRFFRRDKKMGFVALNRDEIELVIRKSFTPVLRPMEEWDRIDQPYMYDFLPRDVRNLAIIEQAKLWTHRADPTRKKPKPNAHPASLYLFSGRLIAKQDGTALTGTLSGPKGDKTPYYRHPRGKRGLRAGSVYNNVIRADVLHDAAVKVLAEVLSDVADLRARLTQFVIDQRNSALQDRPDVAELEKERDDVRLQITSVIRSLSGVALKDAQDDLERLGNRRNAIEERLNQIKAGHQIDARPIEEVVDDAMTLIAQQRGQLATLSIEPLREAIDKLVPSLSVDMETKAVDFTIALPTWAIQRRAKMTKKRSGDENAEIQAENAMCPATSLRSQAGGWTQVLMAFAECTYEQLRGSTTKPPCYACRRKAA